MVSVSAGWAVRRTGSGLPVALLFAKLHTCAAHAHAEGDDPQRTGDHQPFGEYAQIALNVRTSQLTDAQYL